MIALGEGLPLSPCFRSVTGPFEGRFFLWFSLVNEKAPPKAGLFREEHIQESVLVSTLKRSSALLTQIQAKGRESNVSPCLVALSTGTVTVGPQRR